MPQFTGNLICEDFEIEMRKMFLIDDINDGRTPVEEMVEKFGFHLFRKYLDMYLDESNPLSEEGRINSIKYYEQLKEYRPIEEYPELWL